MFCWFLRSGHFGFADVKSCGFFSIFLTNFKWRQCLIFNFDGVRTWYRSSHRRCPVEKMFLKISQNSQENTCARVSFMIKLQACQRLFFNNVAGLRLATLLKQRPWQTCNFIKREILAPLSFRFQYLATFWSILLTEPMFWL